MPVPDTLMPLLLSPPLKQHLVTIMVPFHWRWVSKAIKLFRNSQYSTTTISHVYLIKWQHSGEGPSRHYRLLGIMVHFMVQFFMVLEKSYLISMCTGYMVGMTIKYVLFGSMMISMSNLVTNLWRKLRTNKKKKQNLGFLKVSDMSQTVSMSLTSFSQQSKIY